MTTSLCRSIKFYIYFISNSLLDPHKTESKWQATRCHTENGMVVLCSFIETNLRFIFMATIKKIHKEKKEYKQRGDGRSHKTMQVKRLHSHPL